jgi:transcriptional regulator with PAS, ATPase and Fis domain
MERIQSIFGMYRPLLIDFLNKSADTLPPVYSSVKQTQDSISAELYLPKKEAYIWAKASPLYDQEGNFIGGIETIKDITELKKAEQSLNSSKEALKDRIQGLTEENVRLVSEIDRYQDSLRTRILLEKGLDIVNQRIIITDQRGGIKYISDSMAAYLGIENKHTLIDTNLFNCIDTPSSQTILELLLKRKEGPISIHSTFSTNKNNMVTPLLVSLLVQDEDILGFVFGDLENSMSVHDGKETLGDKLLDEGRVRQVLSQMLLLTPFLTIVPDILSDLMV